ncbi:MAG: type II RES/Xre toxin-antitoxin system antitoxin [Limisphaerales bacterium]
MRRVAKESSLKKNPEAKTGRESGAARLNPTGAGLVHYYIHSEPLKLADSGFNTNTVIKVLERGLPVTELTALQSSLAVSAERLAPMLGISKATFHRSKETGQKLKPSVSDRVVRFAKLLGKAVKALGDMEAAKQWLNSPQFGLGGAVPLDYAKSELGAREVENLLGRIEYGVYS